MARTLSLLNKGADPVGAPDFTLPVSILAQIIESLKVDIVAQTIPKLEINIKSIDSGVVFNVAQSGSWTVNAAQTGAWTINIGQPLDANGNIKTSIQASVTLNVQTPAGVQLNVNIAHIDSGVVFNVAQSGAWTINAAQSGSWTINAVQSGTWTVNVSGTVNVNITNTSLNVNVTNSTLTVTVSGTANVNVTNSTLTVTGSVNITNASLDVNVTNSSLTVTVSGTVNVNVTNSSLTVTISGTPTINVQTSGGANIVIDKLTVGAYTEDRRTLSNNGATATMIAPGTGYRRGKFFPRGTRGFINYLEIYCDNSDTVAHTLYVYISPMPGMAPLFSFSLSVSAGASADWRSVNVREFWNYDSMFVYVLGDSASYPRVGSDTGTPIDYYYSSDEITWVPAGGRYWFRVYLTGETVGDLPVSGTVNTIEVPVESVASSSTQTPAAGTFVECFTISTPGENVALTIRCSASYGQVRVTCDGNVLNFFGNAYLYLADVVNMNGGGFGSQSSAYYTWVSIALPFRWKRTCKVEVGTPAGQAVAAFNVSMIYKKTAD
jgi:hypothetical protein